MTTTKFNSELVNYAIDKLKDGVGNDSYGCGLHNVLYNEDYFIIGYYEAERWLETYPGVFAAIEEIKEYEQNNFGEVNTDFSSSEKVVNMYAYIKGEEILQESKTLQKKWDVRLSEKDIKAIIKELKALL